MCVCIYKMDYHSTFMNEEILPKVIILIKLYEFCESGHRNPNTA